MSNDRIYKIVTYLLNNSGTITYEELAQKLMVSTASIRNDLKQVEVIVQAKRVKLVKIRGNGIKLEGNLHDINQLKNEQVWKKDETSNLNDDRISDLAYLLIENKEEYTRIEDLADILYVSPTTIRNDLTRLKAFLEDEGILLESKKKKGIRIIGEENKLRKIFSKVFASQTKILDPYGFKSTYQPIQKRIISLLHMDPSCIYTTLRKLETTLQCSFSDEAFNTILIHTAIAIKRIQDGKSVDVPQNQSKKGYEKEYEAVSEISKAMGDHYHVIFNETEVYQLFNFIISSNLRYNSTVETIPDDYECLQAIAEDIIQLVENTKQIEIDRTRYIDNLILHIRPLVNRLQRDMNLDNPLLEDIKKEYSDAYGIAWMSNTIFRKFIGKNVSEDEIGFIAIHIQTMIESEEESIKAILVCSNGVGISQLLAMRLKNHFQRIQIVAICSIDSFQKNPYRKEVDLVLSTFPLETDVPVIVVSPLLSEMDIQQINKYLFQNAEPSIPILDEVHVETLLHETLHTQEEVFERVHKYLLQKNFVKDTFYEALCDRERQCSTAIGDFAAIPHASFDTVKQSAIMLVTLDKAIMWNEDPVDLIMFIAFTKRDSRRLTKKLRKLFYKLYQQDTHLQMVSARNKEEIIQVLKR